MTSPYVPAINESTTVQQFNTNCMYCGEGISGKARTVDKNDANLGIVCCGRCYFKQNRNRIVSNLQNLSYSQVCNLQQRMREKYRKAKKIQSFDTRFWSQMFEVVTAYLKLLDTEELL